MKEGGGDGQVAVEALLEISSQEQSLVFDFPTYRTGESATVRNGEVYLQYNRVFTVNVRVPAGSAGSGTKRGHISLVYQDGAVVENAFAPFNNSIRNGTVATLEGNSLSFTLRLIAHKTACGPRRFLVELKDEQQRTKLRGYSFVVHVVSKIKRGKDNSKGLKRTASESLSDSEANPKKSVSLPLPAGGRNSITHLSSQVDLLRKEMSDIKSVLEELKDFMKAGGASSSVQRFNSSGQSQLPQPMSMAANHE